MAADPSSFANVADVRVDHLDLKLNVDFATHIISGAFQRLGNFSSAPLRRASAPDWHHTV